MTMINTYTGTFVDGETLQEWLAEALKDFISQDANVAITCYDEEPRGSSCFFCEVKVNQEITIPELLSKVIKKDSDDSLFVFYVSDVVHAAVTAKKLVGNHFYLYESW